MTTILSHGGMVALTVLMLSGCSVLQRAHGPVPPNKEPTPAPTASTVAPPARSPAPAKPRRPVKEARETVREPDRVAVIDPKSLIGLQPAAVEKLLGAPNAVVKSEPSLVWTYSGQGCSLQIVFYPDLKTASYHALKYSGTAGEQADNSCIRNILTVRSNGPS